MKNNRIVSKLGLAIFIILSTFSFSAFAEYYVVASAPCAGGCCYSNCGPKVIYKKVYRKKYYRPKHHYYRPVHRCGYSTGCGYRSCSSCYYDYGCNGCVRPVYPSAWVRGHWNCYGVWVPGHWRNYYYQTNYAYPTMIYDPDLSTGDDNPMIDPDMDIDR